VADEEGFHADAGKEVRTGHRIKITDLISGAEEVSYKKA